MHLAALAYCGLQGTYELIDLAPRDLRAGVQRLIDEGYNGFNVTIPHKEAVYEMADQRTDWVEAARACNTVKIVDGRMHAHNTDIAGFAEALKLAIKRQPESVCVIGTGGAAKAAILALDANALDLLVVLSREERKAAAFLAELEEHISSVSHMVAKTQADLDDEQFDLIVNCAPLGQNNIAVPVWMDDVIARLDAQGLFFDMVYAKTEEELTPLVQVARKAGKNAVDGAEMLIGQAWKAFQIWTGEQPPLSVFRQAFRAAQQERIRS
jgi:shikimate dehydrogenase